MFTRLKPTLKTLLLASGILGSTASAFAGFTGTTNAYTPTIYNSNFIDRMVVGSQYDALTNFESIIPDLPGEDFGFTSTPPTNLLIRIFATVGSVSGLSWTATGNFNIFYRTLGATTYNDVVISAGTVDLSFTENAGSPFTLSATLSQVKPQFGPYYQLFTKYSGQPMSLLGTAASLRAENRFTIRQNAAPVSPPVPEPAAMAALGLGTVALLRRRRRV